MSRLLAFAVVPLLLLAGCRSEPADSPSLPRTEDSSPASPSDKVIEYATGRSAVRAGLKAKATIQQVNEKRQRDFEQALGE
jgi:hypothetical protein